MTQRQPLSRGVHHLALNTDDMKMTLDFYTRVLGMPLVHALKVRAGSRHRPGQPRQPAVRKPAPLLPRCRRRFAARVLRDPEGRRSPRPTAMPSAPCSTCLSPFPRTRFDEVKRNIEKAQPALPRPGRRRLRHLVDLLLRPERHSPRVLAPEGSRAARRRALAADQVRSAGGAENPVARRGLARNDGRAPARAPLDSRACKSSVSAAACARPRSTWRRCAPATSSCRRA